MKTRRQSLYQPILTGPRSLANRQSRQKPKQSRLIVHDQASSRHPPKNPRPLGRLVLGASLELGIWSFPTSSPLRLRAFALKNPAIKANRASSRQTPFFQTTPSSWRIKPLDWANRQTEDQCVCQGKILSLGRGNRCGGRPTKMSGSVGMLIPRPSRQKPSNQG